ncbi:bifunctional UDP-N-acetylglucosamine diphosphorylase/glucosamine-1-phosphate N-acetyltransferase GlmU [Desulfurispora thermophila]|uniref:bifunctional UDP-N-acetylglucosamine diphosphorylase/glucosamine-1-phosphate N-acetyltransferase GlmU n=1 Tax=Desulfurispora thermophila TaxID=265470 RepID=UPI0003610C7A|nr:bifunctional UDP-N-acetylglucosamine diphosphorylase/glucosamine-1-phosphate N-acetyltransferase GlmU [Desulfurispora thermophila]
MTLAAVVLAAGKGTRMKSGQPKVLFPLGGQPMLGHVLDTLAACRVEKVVVVAGHGLQQVAAYVGERAQVVCQEQQLGTAHALLMAGSALEGFAGDILVLCGDTPLIRPGTLEQLVQEHRRQQAAATVLTAQLADPTGYGRVIREADGRVSRIVEQKDATADELAVKEINTGLYCLRSTGLFAALKEIRPQNAQGEYYLTDIIGLYVGRGERVAALSCADPAEVAGINDRWQLAQAERTYRLRRLEELAKSGVTVLDPEHTYIEVDVTVGPDTVLLPGTYLARGTRIGRGCTIGPNSYLRAAVLGDDVQVCYAVVEESYLGNSCTVGPFAYIRPGCRLADQVKVGDFVELKKATVGMGSKIPHLSYVGDATVGSGVNIGAGTITCNYDGKNKWPTVIEDGAFIGSNTNLVAPVTVGAGAVTGAGSTITKDVPAGALAVERAKQKIVPDWKKKGGQGGE